MQERGWSEQRNRGGGWCRGEGGVSRGTEGEGGAGERGWGEHVHTGRLKCMSASICA